MTAPPESVRFETEEREEVWINPAHVALIEPRRGNARVSWITMGNGRVTSVRCGPAEAARRLFGDGAHPKAPTVERKG